MSPASLAAVVALVCADARPGPRIAADLEDGADPVELLERALTSGADGQQSLLAAAADAALALETAKADLEKWHQEGITVISVLDPAYPENLRGVHDRPPLLFSAGRLEPIHTRAIAVIGSRRASSQGRARADALAAHLVAARFTVVSGLAAGIDTSAHTAALDQGGRTIAVIGTGLRHSYPPENAALQRTIAKRDVVLSPFWPDTPPSRETFPARNGVMSGMSLASVIVEATVTSGARIQARRALAHGRPVFLAAELLEQSWASMLARQPAVHVYREPNEVTQAVERRIALRGLIADRQHADG